nr:unnamed protein product [Callosobruchus analis]
MLRKLQDVAKEAQATVKGIPNTKTEIKRVISDMASEILAINRKFALCDIPSQTTKVARTKVSQGTSIETQIVSVTQKDVAVQTIPIDERSHAKFVKRFNNPPFSSILASSIERSREEVQSLVSQLMQHITACCDSAMPKRKSRANRTPVHWWTPTIDALRKDALKLRRIAQRSRGRTDTGNAREQYRLAKKKLRREIRSSKRQCWLSLC